MPQGVEKCRVVWISVVCARIQVLYCPLSHVPYKSQHTVYGGRQYKTVWCWNQVNVFGGSLGSKRQVMICKGAVMSFHDDVTPLASPLRSSCEEVSSRDMIVALVVPPPPSFTSVKSILQLLFT